MTRIRITFVALIAAWLLPMTANAGLITADPGGGATTTFTQTGLNSAAGPLTLDGISVFGPDIYYGDTRYGLGDNGAWSGFSWVATNSPTNSITFDLGGPVGFVGGFLNYGLPASAAGDPVIAALAADMSVLESYDLNISAPISTPAGLNEGSFRGIERAQADIAFFRLSGAYLLTHDLTSGDSSVVPAPATLALFGLGLAGLGWSRRKKA